MHQGPTRFLLIGCGGIVTAAHLPAFRSHPHKLRIVAACDPSEAARRAVADSLEEHGDVELFAHHEEALRKLHEDIDAAIITTPHFLHFPQAKACLEAGLPVLVEKPVCCTLQETRQLRDLAHAKGLPVVAGQNRRYDPRVIWARDWIRKDPANFGELRSFDMRAWQNIEAWIAGKPDRNADFWILDKERAGGGVVMSLMIHHLDMLRHMTGLDFAGVSAKGRFDAPFRNGAESSCCALLEMSNGAVGTVHANYLVRKLFEPMEVINLVGENGYVGNEKGWQFGTSAGKEPDGWNWQFEGIRQIPQEEAVALSPDPVHFTGQLLAFARAVQDGTEPWSSIGDNFNTMAVVEAICESMLNGGKSVKVAIK